MLTDPQLTVSIKYSQIIKSPTFTFSSCMRFSSVWNCNFLLFHSISQNLLVPLVKKYVHEFTCDRLQFGY